MYTRHAIPQTVKYELERMHLSKIILKTRKLVHHKLHSFQDKKRKLGNKTLSCMTWRYD